MVSGNIHYYTHTHTHIRREAEIFWYRAIYVISHTCARARTHTHTHTHTPGEILVSGNNVSEHGYYKMPEETGQAFIRHADGKLWFHTGDVGVMVRSIRRASVCVLAGDVWYGERRKRRWVLV